MNDFLRMLSSRRPAEGFGEAWLVQEFIRPLGAMPDAAGNYWVVTDPESKTLFCAHLDTVHHDNTFQNIVHDKEKNIVYKDDGEPLGADDAAGVWILIQLIKAEVPGTYLFHTGEERGGIGSGWAATYKDEELEHFDRAIAFDRRGTGDIITYQSGGRCCSETFAHALANELDMGHKPCPNGVFTDTANYTHLIPECTNVSVGYNREHTQHETQDLTYLAKLAERCKNVNWEELPIERNVNSDLYEDPDDLYDLCLDDPITAADLLMEYGVTVRDFVEAQEGSHYNSYRHKGLDEDATESYYFESRFVNDDEYDDYLPRRVSG